jgi:deazaflavin-dependent oxidoreductase (nitroreductase family)
VLLLTTTGAKSGLPRTTPLNYSLDGDRIVVIASKAASPAHPDWYHNLVANPQATIEIGTEKFPVRAKIAAGDERERLFNAQAALMPFFAEYQQQTTRQIPVIIFERIG